MVKPWQLCKKKEITNPPTLCKLPDCTQSCAKSHPGAGGFGFCIAEFCLSMHSCHGNRQPPRDAEADQPFDIFGIYFRLITVLAKQWRLDNANNHQR
ncbi:hypothetical protein ACFX12_026968 [Malus domestica]